MKEIDKKILNVLKNVGTCKKYSIREAFEKFNVNLYFIRNIQTCDFCKKEYPVHDEEFELLGLEEMAGYNDIFDLDNDKIIQIDDDDFIYYPDYYDEYDKKYYILCPDCHEIAEEAYDIKNDLITSMKKAGLSEGAIDYIASGLQFRLLESMKKLADEITKK